MRETGESKGIFGAIAGIAVIVALIAGGYYLKKHSQRADREADLAKQREERVRNADPGKTLRDAQRMEEITRKRVEQQRAATQAKEAK